MMTKTKTTYGIIGYPVKYSLSPAMHNTAFTELDVDAEYKLFPLKEEELGDFLGQLKKKKSPIFGLNVTVPYKEKVIPYLDSLGPFAQKVGAVNTIVISDDRKIVGHNTDGPGFLSHLAELSCDVKDKRVAILGAGGTTRAVLAALALLPERPESIKIYNRTYENLNILLKDLGQRVNLDFVEPVESIDDLNVELADLLINTTSIGMKDSDPCLIDESILHPNMLVYDVIYSPAETKLLKLAKSQGARTSNGLGLLFYQGVLALQRWADMQISPEIKEKMRDSLNEALKS